MTKFIQYGNSKIDYELEFSNRKTLGIRVHPDRSVQIIAPEATSIDVIENKMRSKASWILKQQDFFLQFHPKTPARKFVSGETHLYLGKQYRLKVVESDKESVKLFGGNIWVYVNSKTDNEAVKRLLKQWYATKAKKHFTELYDKCLPIAKTIHSGPTKLQHRWMTKRWGSCDKDGVIHLNYELIKAPKKCIEYVIIHEMCHLLHLNHSKAFYELLESVYPEWIETKSALERLMV
jgi:predicted metal-dependent hydrolase